MSHVEVHTVDGLHVADHTLEESSSDRKVLLDAPDTKQGLTTVGNGQGWLGSLCSHSSPALTTRLLVARLPPSFSQQADC